MVTEYNLGLLLGLILSGSEYSLAFSMSYVLVVKVPMCDSGLPPRPCLPLSGSQ